MRVSKLAALDRPAIQNGQLWDPKKQCFGSRNSGRLCTLGTGRKGGGCTTARYLLRFKSIDEFASVISLLCDIIQHSRMRTSMATHYTGIALLSYAYFNDLVVTTCSREFPAALSQFDKTDYPTTPRTSRKQPQETQQTTQS